MKLVCIHGWTVTEETETPVGHRPALSGPGESSQSERRNPSVRNQQRETGKDLQLYQTPPRVPLWGIVSPWRHSSSVRGSYWMENVWRSREVREPGTASTWGGKFMWAGRVQTFSRSCRSCLPLASLEHRLCSGATTVQTHLPSAS